MKDPCLHLLVICDAIYVIPFWRKHDFTTWISTSNIKLEMITFSIRLSKYLVNPCYVVKLNSSRCIPARKKPWILQFINRIPHTLKFGLLGFCCMDAQNGLCTVHQGCWAATILQHPYPPRNLIHRASAPSMNFNG